MAADPVQEDIPEALVSFSFDHDGARLLVETTKDATAGTLLHLIAKNDEEKSCAVYQTILSEEDIPKLGYATLDAKYLIDYIQDGKEKKNGCSLVLKKEDSEMLLSVSEKRGKRRPPFVISIRLAEECRVEEKLSLLERVYLSLKKETGTLCNTLQTRIDNLEEKNKDLQTKIKETTDLLHEEKFEAKHYFTLPFEDRKITLYCGQYKVQATFKSDNDHLGFYFLFKKELFDDEIVVDAFVELALLKPDRKTVAVSRCIDSTENVSSKERLKLRVDSWGYPRFCKLQTLDSIADGDKKVWFSITLTDVVTEKKTTRPV